MRPAACQGPPRRRVFIFTLVHATAPCLYQVFRLNPILKINAELIQRLTPVPSFAGPFLGDINHSQIQRFEQGIICRKDALGLCYFPELTIEIFNCICGIMPISWDYFEYVIPLLEKEYRMIVPDLPGYDFDENSDFTSVE